MTERRFLPEGYSLSTGSCGYSIGELQRAAAAGMILESTVQRCDSSDMSLHLDLGCIRGVMPREEVIYSPREYPKDIAVITRVGKTVAFVIKGFREIGGRTVAILSRRAVQERCMRDYVRCLVPGDIIPVRVTHLEPFGAFVDIGCGIISLASVDTLSVSRISHPSDRVSVGDRLMAVVKSVDRETGRIYVSTRELLGTWEENAALFAPSQTVTGVVRSVEDYGIFVELSPNLAGLAEYRPGVKPGDGCAVYIKSMIPERMKVKLVMIDHVSEAVSPRMRMFVDTDRVRHMDRWVYSPACSHKVIETVFKEIGE